MIRTLGGFFRQTAALSLLAFRSWRGRWTSSLVAIVGFATVAAILVSVLSLATSISRLYRQSGAADVAMVLGEGAFAESGSRIPAPAIDRLAQAGQDALEPGVAISRELLVTTELPRASGGTALSVPVRGVMLDAQAVHGPIDLVSGRMFRPGLNEVVIGRQVAGAVAGARLGRRLTVGGTPFEVVGIFAAGGGLRESEMLGDLVQIGEAIGMPLQVSSAYAKLRSPGQFDAFAQAIAAVPGLGLDVFRESEYRARQGAQYRRFVLLPGLLVVLLISVSALLASINTMQTLVHARLRETSTLRALGFGAAAVTAAVIVEASAIGAAGGVAGAALPALLLGDAQIVTSDGLEAVTLTMEFGPAVFFASVLAALVVGVLGGMWPAARAARWKVAEGLRQS